MITDAVTDECGPWNPGITSQVPADILPLASIFRPENVFTSLEAARELQAMTGLSLAEVVRFRPQRLALHELLIRVTADFTVPDGSRIGDLGINFRRIAGRLLTEHVAPRMAELVAVYEQAHQELKVAADTALREVASAPAPQAAVVERRRGPRLFRRAASSATAPATQSLRAGWELPQIALLETMSGAAGSSQAIIRQALVRVMSALFATHGQSWGTRDFIISVAADVAANAYCSAAIGSALGAMLANAVSRGDYRQLPSQERPIVINTKGASAAGKSTLRPLQQRLAREIGVGWEDFALISPDIWRKQLLDYEALGPAYKYAGALSADELQVIDHKLDSYMARKNQSGKMSHLLIDRFRFDSFAPASDEAGSNLLTRFGQTVFMFFVITPPESLIERAWNRGLEFGRYKAVDDTLAHAVEAYGGIPNVFFTWIRRSDKSIRFEFLDNAVPLGEPPWTVAFGDNTTCNVLDIQNLLNIVRFGRIDVNATSAAGLYPDREILRGELNVEFLRRCIAEFQHVNFAEQITGKVFLQIESGKPVWKDSTTMQAVLSNQDTRAALDSVANPSLVALAADATEARYLLSAIDAAQTPSLGRWGRSN